MGSARRLAPIVACALLAIPLTSCVIVPYSPPSKAESVPVQLDRADEVLLSVGPREFLDDTGTALRRRDRGLDVVDGLAFRNAVFPDGDWRLSRLLNADDRARLADSGADYLVVVGKVEAGKPEEHGAFLAGGPYGFYGAASATVEGSALVLIIDLAKGSVLDMLRASATGTDVAVGLFYGLIFHAMTESSVRDECLDSIVDTIRRAQPRGQVKVVLMAAEPVNASTYPLSIIAQ